MALNRVYVNGTLQEPNVPLNGFLYDQKWCEPNWLQVHRVRLRLPPARRL